LAPPARPPGDASYFESFSAAYNYGWAPLRGVVADGYKFIDLPLPELYDLKTDPSERENLFARRSAEARGLRRRIPAESAIDTAARSRPDSEAAKRLRSLGYLSGSAAVLKSYTAADDPKRLVGVNRDMYRYVELYQRGDLSGATTLARKVVRERPTMALAYVHLAFLLRRQNESAAALEVYRAAASRGIANEELTVHYGLTLCEVGRPGEAVKLLRRFSDSPEPNTLNALGIALADSEHRPEAIEIFQRVLRLDPENVEAHENMGVVHLRSENFSGARDSFRRAVAIDERTPRAWNGLGVALARLGDRQGAIAAWSRSVALDPTMYEVLFNLGLTAAQAGLLQQAQDALERFISTAPPARYGADIAEAHRVLKSLGLGGH
ncbi:MAG: tetratricopeptide repeat protein, partial [Acidobacteriota bacterium]|nr:tetratricopeptide repeat protein [Acidobacteriota bacterium]